MGSIHVASYRMFRRLAECGVSQWEVVMCCKGEIAGFAAVEPREDGDSELDAMFVEPRMQRRGIGKALVEYCAEVSRQEGSAHLHVVGNPHAESFYLACGFEVIGTTNTRFGPGLLMRRAVRLRH